MKIRVKVKKYGEAGKIEQFQYADSAGNVSRDMHKIISDFIYPVNEEEQRIEIELKKLNEKSPEEKAEFLKKQNNEKS